MRGTLPDRAAREASLPPSSPVDGQSHHISQAWTVHTTSHVHQKHARGGYGPPLLALGCGSAAPLLHVQQRRRLARAVAPAAAAQQRRAHSSGGQAGGSMSKQAPGGSR